MRYVYGGLVILLLFSGIARGGVYADNRGTTPYFAALGEGLTSPSASEGIDVAFRMYTSQDDVCEGVGRVRGLVVHNKTPVTLHVSQWFPLSDLRVVATDAYGQLIQVPIKITIELKYPAVINTRSDMVAEGKILPVHTGDFRLRIREMCGVKAVEVGMKVIR